MTTQTLGHHGNDNNVTLSDIDDLMVALFLGQICHSNLFIYMARGG